MRRRHDDHLPSRRLARWLREIPPIAFILAALAALTLWSLAQ